MPFLMVNLDDAGDCERALRHLSRRVRRMKSGCGQGPERESHGRHRDGEGNEEASEESGQRSPPGRGSGPRKGPGVRPKGGRGRGRRAEFEPSAKITLRQKLERIRRRGVWRFLAQIAELSEQPRSLAELDNALDLPRNKMRSTKAIFAKLENRLDVRFLVLDEDAGEDEAGNPRYVMPKRIRKQIRKLINE